MLSVSLRQMRTVRPERLALRLRQPVVAAVSKTTCFMAARQFSQTAKLLDAEPIDGKSIAKYVMLFFFN